MKIGFVAILADAAQDRMMHAADVFEPFKALGKCERLEAEFPDAYDEKAALIALKLALEEAGGRVSGIFVPGNPETAIFDESVTVISDGTKWSLMSDIRKAYQV